MNCKDANNKISLLIDGLLDEEQVGLLFEHFEVCGECRKLYDDMKGLVSNLNTLPEMPLPNGAENKIHFALEREAKKPKKKNWIKFTAIAMPAAVGAFAIIIGVTYMLSGGLMMGASEDSAVMESYSESTTTTSDSTYESNEAELFAAGEGAEEGYDTAMSEDQDSAPEASDEARTFDSDDVSGMSKQQAPYMFSVVAEIDADTLDEADGFAKSLMGDIGLENAYEYTLDGVSGNVRIVLPIYYYASMIEILESSDEVSSIESGFDSAAGYDENLLFEVNFFFQKN